MMQTREQQRRWVILACIPRVVPDGEASPPATDFSFQCKAPPEPCCLTVPRCMAPDPKDIENHPYVAAVSDHGRFLLYATLGNDDLVPGEPPFVDRFHSEPLGLTLAATRLPDHDPDPDRPILHPGNVGLVSYIPLQPRIKPDDPVVSVVVELRPTTGEDHAALIWYASWTNSWYVWHDYPAPAHRKWGGHRVITPADAPDSPRLTWGPEPPLRFIPLPDGCEERVGRADLDKTRCVGMSAGSLRYVQIHRRGADPIVSMWTLLDWDDARSWRRDSTISFSLIWADSGYRAMELPEVVPTGSPAGATDLLPDEVPAVAFIDPDHGHTVYFLLRSRLFGVDVRTGKFLRWQHFKMDHPPSRYHSSRFVRLWNLSQEIFNNAYWCIFETEL
ncbi:hypothetical protein BRADI_2g08585v3 [Brachypodium distachyon]|uniref:DUF1618 domain-containing protein n=1 Tax=Brachypodium distachyon TaxID=15368 RepID=A0A0Q3JYJ8_BRADI|nr:hypothetical protein BRADI_2g08585v3 [Brachypodium distachyon]